MNISFRFPEFLPMKKPSLSLLAGISLLPACLVAQVRETPAVLALADGGNPQGYVQGANEQGLLWATTPGGAAQVLPYERIRGEGLDKVIRFSDRPQVLASPRALFSSGQYAEAAEGFGAVARDYGIILNAPQNFATEALFYQIESLKRAGQYSALAPLVESPAAATIVTKLGPAYQRAFELQKIWALFGKNDLVALKTALDAYQEPVLGAEKLLKAPNFKPMPLKEVAQLAFLRAKIFESEGEKDKALEDYYRTFTLAFGNDVLLAKLAMGAAMVLQKDDPRIAAEEKGALNQMRSIAYLYSLRFGKDSMPTEFQGFAVKPEVPRVVPAPEPPAEAAAPAEAPKEGAPPAESKPAEAEKAK